MGIDATPDVAVVGGGLVGASAAYELACAGARVTLFDAALAGRASDAGAGIVSPETFHDADPYWFEFAAAAARHLHQLVARLDDEGVGPGPGAYATCGSLVVALAEHEDPWLAEVLGLASARSAAVTEISPEEAGRLFPPLAPVWRALHNPSAARVDGRRLRLAVVDGARRRGVSLVEAEVLGLERRGERVTAVRTAQGEVACGAVVLAGGAWSAEAGPWIGTELAVAPTKGQIVHVVLPHDGATADTALPPTDRWPIVQPVLNFYLVPWPHGRVACGGTFEPEARFDTRPTAAGMRDLLRECLTIAPGLGVATFGEIRVGLRPTSVDDRPLLGAVPGTDNVSVCTGHGANGLLLGPYSAAVVAAEVTGGSAVPVAHPASGGPYAAARLAGG